MVRCRVLLVGDYAWPWYQEACAKALELLGCDVIRFSFFDSFMYRSIGSNQPVYYSMYHRVQYRFKWGPTVYALNRSLLHVAHQEKPDIIWFYNVQLIMPGTLKKMRQLLPNAVFCQYDNDNPFSPDSNQSFWSNHLKCIQYFDLHFAYRYQNIDDYQRYGANRVSLLRSYFIPEDDHPVLQDEIPDEFKCDVVFVGHYEDDGRLEMLEAICKAGVDLRLYGGGWNSVLVKNRLQQQFSKQASIRPVIGKEYQYAICGAKVALCFLSTMNQDTYTRRNFQIPAMKTAILSQYTDDLITIFKPDTEAMFFKDTDELLSKLKLLLANIRLRTSIAEAGYKRVYEDGHDVYSRMSHWLELVLAWRRSYGEI